MAQKREVEYTGPVDHEGNPRHPASDLTAAGGVFRDDEGYHDALGNRLTDEEAEQRLNVAGEARNKKLGEPGTSRPPVVDRAAPREANPPAPVEPALQGTAGDPSTLDSVQEAEKQRAEDAEKLREATKDSHSTQDEEARRKDAAKASGGADMPPKRASATETSTGGRSSSSGASGADYDGMTKDELAKHAESRGLTVKRSGGEEGEPLKEDYIRALKRDDRK